MSELPPLCAKTLWAILNDQLPDEVVNRLVWDSLGYRQDPSSGQWDCQMVDPVWAERYPSPPDFVASRPATVQLTRSIPKPHKQLLKADLGFKGYSIDQLVPRLTRRATMTSWLLSYMKDHDISL